MTSHKALSPAAVMQLRDALGKTFWYKDDLRSFLVACLPPNYPVERLPWGETKKTVVNVLVESLQAQPSSGRQALVGIMNSLADIVDPVWLKQLEDGVSRYNEAVSALSVLRTIMGQHRTAEARPEADARRAKERSAAETKLKAKRESCQALQSDILRIAELPPQERGYAFEKFLNQLFNTMDILARQPFRITGEQIDGAFSLDRQDFLLEAKWTAGPIGLAEVDVFAGKLRRKLDNTIGLFISMNGFHQSAITPAGGGRPSVLLADGGDIYAVLEGRIELDALIDRKRRHAAQTGEVYFPVSQMFG